MKNSKLTQETHDIGALATELGIPLPQETKVQYLERESEGDAMVRAKLTLSQAAFDKLASQLPVRQEELRPGAGRLGTDHEGWDPHATAGLLSGQAQLPSARYLHIGVAPRPDGNVTLFVLKHGT